VSALTLALIGLVTATDPVPPADPAAFPVPAGKGMRLDGQAREFAVPFGIARVEKFYREQFAGRKDIALTRKEEDSQPVLIITSLAKKSRWTRAVVTTNGVTCRIALTRVVTPVGETIAGELPPVQFIIARSAHVKDQLDSIDHLEH
jgi:hypothetical protein